MCGVPNQWIAQQQVGPGLFTIYCDCLRVSCPMSAAWHFCEADIGQSNNAKSRQRQIMTSDV